MNSGYRDREKAETVNIVKHEQILSFLQKKYKDEGVCVDATDLVKGEVLTDSRGHGSLQRTRQKFCFTIRFLKRVLIDASIRAFFPSRILRCARELRGLQV